MSSETHRFEFRMPDPGEGLTEAELDAWQVAEGDEVTEADVLCEVETDKAIVEIPVPCDGEVLELRADPGDVVAVGDVIAVFETEDPPSGQHAVGDTGGSGGEASDAESSSGEASETERSDANEAVDDPESAVSRVTDDDQADGDDADADQATDDQANDGQASQDRADEDQTDKDSEEVSASGERVFAAPSTRRYAREQGVDLTAVEGSGPGGRVLRDDVDRHAEAETSRASATDQSPPPGTGSVADADEHGPIERRPLRGLRATIAENMVESTQTIPHVTSMFEADATDLVELKENLDEKLDAPVSYPALVLKAVAPALEAYPALNASIDEAAGEIVEKHYYNLGVATHTEDGLMVPVVKDVDQKSIAEVSQEVADLAERARDRSVDASDLGGGTFTVTNTGSHSEHGTFGTPIIRHPEVAVLGMARVQRKPVAVGEDEMEVRPVLPLSLSYDHRLVDGVTASQFAEHVIEAIEDRDVFTARL